MSLYVGLQLSEKFFNGIQIWRIWHQIYQFNSRTKAQMLNLLKMMEGCIVHYCDWPIVAARLGPTQVYLRLLSIYFKHK